MLESYYIGNRGVTKVKLDESEVRLLTQMLDVHLQILSAMTLIRVERDGHEEKENKPRPSRPPQTTSMNGS